MPLDRQRNRLAPVMLLALAVAVLDQASKHIVMRTVVFGEIIRVVPCFFSITHLRNSGAVWGLFPGQSAVLVFLSIITLWVLLVVYRKAPPNNRLRAALALMLGGVFGNLSDRIAYGYVVDFLDFHLAGRHWPAFNVADAAICIGIGLYLCVAWTLPHTSSRTSDIAQSEVTEP